MFVVACFAWSRQALLTSNSLFWLAQKRLIKEAKELEKLEKTLAKVTYF